MKKKNREIPNLDQIWGFLKISYQHNEIQKYFNVLCALIILIKSTVKISFWYLLVLYVNFSVKSLKFVPKWPLSYFQPTLVALLATIAMVKVKLIPEFFTWAIILIKQ